MDTKIIVCEKCKKESDSIKLTALTGDEKYLAAGTKVSQWKCKRCERILDDNEKMFVVIPL